MFDDDTGEALNPAARKLVQEALAADELALEANGGAAPELGPILASIPVVDCAEGTYKYVQVQLSHPDEPGTQLLVVRSYATCRYHAENYMKLMRILRADERTRGVVGRVIGGGRIRFDPAASPPSCEVYGYSKTFGRVAGCNEKTAAIVRANCPGFADVRWSDEGY